MKKWLCMSEWWCYIRREGKAILVIVLAVGELFTNKEIVSKTLKILIIQSSILMLKICPTRHIDIFIRNICTRGTYSCQYYSRLLCILWFRCIPKPLISIEAWFTLIQPSCTLIYPEAWFIIPFIWSSEDTGSNN